MPLSRLNQEQLSAATAPYGQNLVIASAGTGKTSTIVGRIAHLLHNGVKPQEILLLTFTNKAAAEMVERVAVYFSKEVALQIEAGTFHAVCYRLLKKRDPKVLLKQQSELKTLFRSIYEKRAFSRLDYEQEEYAANYLYDIYSFYQNTELSLSFGDWMELKYPEHACWADIYQDICTEYEAMKDSYGYLNFNDLLLKAKYYLGSEIQTNFQEVLIDEYQDTNSLQGSIIDKMQPPSLFCVGDYDQSIYAFNGANIDIIGSFSKKHLDAKVFTLKKNYRSTKAILSLADRVIRNNERIYPKELIVVRDGIPKPPALLEYEELFEQYQAVATKIKDNSSNYDNVAVIFRNNSSADGIEASLRELGISCKRKGGTSFFDAKEVKVLFDLYSFFINPKDMMAFIHVFEYAKGIGSAIAKELFEALKTLGRGSVHWGFFHPDLDVRNPFEKRKVNYQLALFDDLHELGSIGHFAKLGLEEKVLENPVLKHPKLTEDGATFINDFYKLYKAVKRIERPFKMIDVISGSSIYKNIAYTLATKRAMQKDKTINEEQRERSLENINRKVKLIKNLTTHYDSHERFLNAMVLGSNEMAKGEGVNLLTVHASKGLEFKDVYILDLMDGRFPNRKLVSKGGSIDEERRLFYVAVTRAKDRLWLSYAKEDKIKKMKFLPSLFLYEAGLKNNKEEYEKLLIGKD